MIGYVGLGSMGSRMAARLLPHYPVAAFDRDETALKRIGELGATVCASGREVAEQSEIVLLCLPTSDHVRSVLFGEDGVAAGARPGTIVVDQTTGDPAETREMAARARVAGWTLIDAPVSGGPMGAEAGTLAVIVGAEPTDYAVVEPVLKVISPNVFHVGGVGSGHVTKIVNNLLSAVHRVASLEALALAAKNGVDPGQALEVILAGSGRNFYLETFGRSHLLSGALDSGFTLELLHKDVRLACTLGEGAGVPMYFGNLVKDFYQVCMNDQGGSAEVNNAALVFDRLAGTNVIPTRPTS
jgi:3-hydroxyisobutyrate dehydrogenase